MKANSSVRWLPRAVGIFVAGYLLVNLANTVLTLVYTAVAHTPSAPDLGVSYLYDPAYQRTVPFHVIINLVVWTGAGIWYFRPMISPRMADRLRLAAAWLIFTAVIDAVVYVVLLGNTRWGLPPHDFYIGNQPWISLTYLSIVIGPLLAAALVRRPANESRPGHGTNDDAVPIKTR